MMNDIIILNIFPFYKPVDSFVFYNAKDVILLIVGFVTMKDGQLLENITLQPSFFAATTYNSAGIRKFRIQRF